MFNSYPQKKRREPWMYITLALAGTLILGLTIYFIATPFIVVNNMRNAAAARDGRTFASYIDFPQFRENLKAELNAAVAAKMASDTTLRDNPFSGLGAVFGPTVINNMVDAYVTPQGFERMMSSRGSSQPQQVNNQITNIGEGRFLDEGSAELAYTGINEFQVAVKDKDGPTTVLIFQRHYLISWRLANLKLPR